MSNSYLTARVACDDPYRTYYGSDDPVHGKIVLEVQRKGSRRPADIATTVQLDVIFKGTFKHGQHTPPAGWTSAHTLFTRVVAVHAGPVNVRAGIPLIFPFTLTFPAAPDTPTFSGPDNSIANTQLPPSLVKIQRGTAADAFPSLEVAYTLRPRVRFPAAPQVCRADSQLALRYDRARVPLAGLRFRPVASSTPFTVAPPEPPSKSQRLKQSLGGGGGGGGSGAAHAASGGFAFTVTASDLPTHIYADDVISFTLGVEPQHPTAAGALPPRMEVAGLMIGVVARTRLAGGSWRLDVEKVLSLVGAADPPGPFGGAAGGGGWTKTVRAFRGVEGVASGFVQGGLTRSYALLVEATLSVGGQMVRFRKMIGVELHPPRQKGGMDAERAVSAATAARLVAELELSDDTSTTPSPPPPDYSEGGPRLPAYEEEQLPSYEEAMGHAIPSVPAVS